MSGSDDAGECTIFSIFLKLIWQVSSLQISANLHKRAEICRRGLGQYARFTGVADAVLVEVLPQAHLGERRVLCVEDLVAVAVERGEGLEAIARIAGDGDGLPVDLLGDGDLGVHPEQFTAGVGGARGRARRHRRAASQCRCGCRRRCGRTEPGRCRRRRCRCRRRPSRWPGGRAGGRDGVVPVAIDV